MYMYNYMHVEINLVLLKADTESEATYDVMQKIFLNIDCEKLTSEEM